MQTDNSLPILDAQGITKRFGAVLALKDASLTLRKGQIVALRSEERRVGKEC